MAKNHVQKGSSEVCEALLPEPEWKHHYDSVQAQAGWHGTAQAMKNSPPDQQYGNGDGQTCNLGSIQRLTNHSHAGRCPLPIHESRSDQLSRPAAPAVVRMHRIVRKA
ncbi:MAG: hypothetical protein ACYDGU_01115 [Acidiferrobacterales bacterium]